MINIKKLRENKIKHSNYDAYSCDKCIKIKDVARGLTQATEKQQKEFERHINRIAFCFDCYYSLKDRILDNEKTCMVIFDFSSVVEYASIKV